MDVVCVRDSEGQFYSTEFYVKFKVPILEQASVALLGISEDESNALARRAFSMETTEDIRKGIRKDLEDASKLEAAIAQSKSGGTDAATLEMQNYLVDISCNSIQCEDIRAFVGAGHLLHFYDPTRMESFRTPPSEYWSLFPLIVGRNNITARHRASGIVVDFFVWVYHPSDRLVVMDIDGTITRSDVTGYIQTVYLGLYTYIHNGTVDFLTALQTKFDFKFLYLTARPMGHRKETMALLQSIRGTDDAELPEGPLFTAKDRLMQALYREIFIKDTAYTKADVLLKVSEIFKAAGCAGISPYVLGIGNKEHDALAYNSAGLTPERILLIDTSSKISTWRAMQSRLLAKQGSGKHRTKRAQTDRSNGVTRSANVEDGTGTRDQSPVPSGADRSKSNSAETESSILPLEEVSVDEESRDFVPDNSELPNPPVTMSGLARPAPIKKQSSWSFKGSRKENPPSIIKTPAEYLALEMYTFNSYSDPQLLNYITNLTSNCVL